MRTLSRGLALAVVSMLALTGCIKVEMNVTLEEDDTASGDLIFAVSQDLLAIAGEEGLEEMLNSEDTIPGGTTERYESEDGNDDGNPDFVGTKTTFDSLPITEFDAAGDGMRIFRDGDDYVVAGAADDLTEEAGGEELPSNATATLSVTFPGKVSDHNGELDGNTVTWDLLTHEGELQARGSATADSGFPLWIILVIAGVIGIGAGIAAVLIISARRKSVDESQVVGDPTAPGTDPAVAGTPAFTPDAPVAGDPTQPGTPNAAPAYDGIPASEPVDPTAPPATEPVDPTAPPADDEGTPRP